MFGKFNDFCLDLCSEKKGQKYLETLIGDRFKNLSV